MTGALVERHRLATRLWHWLNAVTLYVLFTSGLGIFNAHPRLYWGIAGANFDAPWFERARFGAAWTLPAGYSLAMSRRWHLTFALVLGFSLLGYMVASLWNGHFRRDIAFRRGELGARPLLREIRDHARLRFPSGEAARRYNVLQKASYAGVLFVALPIMILTGLAMSPAMDAAWPWLLDLFGGRQSARSIHFVVAWALALFTLVHVLMVLASGPLNQMRGMITGRYRLPPERGS